MKSNFVIFYSHVYEKSVVTAGYQNMQKFSLPTSTVPVT